jgi:hypothetical protein
MVHCFCRFLTTGQIRTRPVAYITPKTPNEKGQFVKRTIHQTLLHTNRKRLAAQPLTPNPLPLMALILVLAAGRPFAQPAAGAFDDHQNMMDQLGVKTLRRGPDPNNQSTFDEAIANPYTNSMPDMLTTNLAADLALQDVAAAVGSPPGTNRPLPMAGATATSTPAITSPIRCPRSIS